MKNESAAVETGKNQKKIRRYKNNCKNFADVTADVTIFWYTRVRKKKYIFLMLFLGKDGSQ